MREHRAQPARAQAEAALAVAVRDGEQRLLGGAHNEGQNHHGKRQCARQTANSPSASAVTKNSMPNRPYRMDGMPESVSAVRRTRP